MLDKWKPWQKIVLGFATVGVTITVISLGIDKYRKWKLAELHKNKTPDINIPLGLDIKHNPTGQTTVPTKSAT